MTEIIIHDDIIELLYKRIQGKELSAAELLRLEEWGQRSPEYAALIGQLGNDEYLMQAIKERYRLDKVHGWENISAHFEIPELPRVHFMKKAWFRYAAAILLLVVTGAYFMFRAASRQTPNTIQTLVSVDVAPGREGAVLTLADGSQMLLDSMGNGVVATQNGVQVVLQNGALNYDAVANNAGTVVYNTMRTPKGRQFSLTLPDGTKVWLNAASSIRYPTAFTEKERRVELIGEGYFEVAPDKQKPFFVKMNNRAEVQVLGTKFNVNAYEEEAGIYTTLLEGKVQVNQLNEKAAPKLLQPGQQMKVEGSQLLLVKDPDLDKVMAWKNGLFNFEGAGLKEMMRQLERWYNIEVVYEGEVADTRFFGKMSRQVNLSTVLTALKGFGLKFRFTDDGKLIVTP